MKGDRKSLGLAALAAFGLFLGIYYWPSIAGAVKTVGGAAVPLGRGCAIAYIANILMGFYERHYFPKSAMPLVRKSARPVCLIAAFLTVVLILAAVIGLVVPELVGCVKLMLQDVPAALDEMFDEFWAAEILSPELQAELESIDLAGAVTTLVQGVTSGLGSILTVAADIVSSVVNLVLGLIFAIYILLGKEKLSGQCTRLMVHFIPQKWNDKIRYVLSVLDNAFRRYIVGQCTEAVILGILCAVGMKVFGFPYAAMTGAVVGVTALIPVAGAYIGGAVGFLLIFTVSPVQALLFLVYLVILQQLENNLIYPRVVGASIGLPGIWVLAAVTVGGGIGGVGGMLLGVPLASAAYQMLRDCLHQKEAALKDE